MKIDGTAKPTGQVESQLARRLKWRRRYRDIRDSGLCITCRRLKGGPGVRCQACRERVNAKQRERKGTA